MGKTNLKTVAYNAIRQKIVTCEYAPGTFLNEEILTETLNLSRTPVRDALSRLEQEGLVEIKAKRGITVAPLTVNDINMTFEVRNLFEPYILRTYGSKLPENKLLEFYHFFLKQSTNCDYSSDTDEFYELDSEFHMMILDCCDNRYIQRSYEQIRTQDARFRRMTGSISGDRLSATFKEHLDIVVPCLQKDWNLAAEKMILHLEESKKATFRLIFDKMGNSQIHL